MTSFVTKIVAIVLVVSCLSVNAGLIFAKSKAPREPGGKYGFQSDWVKVNVTNVTYISVPVGGSFKIDCDAIGSPPPAVKWYHQETFLFETGFPEQNEVGDVAVGKLSSRLVIGCVLPRHQGVYSCSGSSSSNKRSTQSVTVIVEAQNDLPVPESVCDKNKPSSPTIVTSSPTLLEFAGRDAVLPCAAVGNPIPSVYWLTHAGGVINSQTRSSHHKVLDNGSLKISHIAWEDMGVYTCVAENALGKETIESFLYPVKNSE